jgi:hypothetical protein
LYLFRDVESHFIIQLFINILVDSCCVHWDRGTIVHFDLF